MKPIDLGTASGFALATQGAASSVMSLLGYDPSMWDIAEASYEGVVFHVFAVKDGVDYNAALSRISDAGGRRKAKFMFPYQDGQIMDDLGRLPETFSIEALIFGPNYKAALDKLMKKLQQPQPGKYLRCHGYAGSATQFNGFTQIGRNDHFRR